MSPRLVLVAHALIGFGDAGAAEPGRPSPAQACAAFDVHVLTRLEDHGRAAGTAGSALATAMTDLIEARAACFRGDHDLALDRYSRIDLQGPPPASADVADAR